MQSGHRRNLAGLLLVLGIGTLGVARLAAAPPGHSFASPTPTAAPALPTSNAPTPVIPLNPNAAPSTPVPVYTPVFPSVAPRPFATPAAPPSDIPVNPDPVPATPVPVYTPDPPRGTPAPSGTALPATPTAEATP
jgi:hypothetical protein